MKRALILAACAAALLAGCSPSKPKATAAAQGKFDTELTMAELMGHVVDPAAWTYWHGSGTVVTAKGEEDLTPTTEEGWVQLENGAATLREAGNLLQLPGRVQEPAADWNRYAQLLTTRAIAAKTAAEKHDKTGVFDEGGRVYEVCTSCHKQFVIDPMLKAQGGAGTSTLPDLPKTMPKPPAEKR